MIAEGDLVATHKALHVTHQGEFRGIPPTGEKRTIANMDVFRVRDGKMVEHWGIVDFTRMMRTPKGEGPPQR